MANGSIFGLDLLLIATTFLGALVAFEGIRQALSRQETPHDARSRRMRMIARSRVDACTISFMSIGS